MGSIFKWIFGGVMGLLTFCAGVGPNEAASHLSEWLLLAGVERIPPWLASPRVDTWVFWTGIIGLFVWLGFVLSPRLWRRFQKSKSETNDVPEFISMKDAATRLYSEARARKAPLAKEVEDLRGDAIVNFMISYLRVVEIPIWGKKPPSTLCERISKDEVKQMTFNAEGTELIFLGQSAAFTDVQVKSTDLERVIADMRTMNGTQ